MPLGLLDKFFIKKLKRALEYPKVNPIPRSGPEGETVNCYSIYVTDDSGSYLAERIEGDLLVSHKWNDEQKSHNLRYDLNLKKLETLNFEITHHHGLMTYSYNSTGMFLKYEVTGYYKLVSLLTAYRYKIPKIFHRNKPLKRPTRIKVLETLDLMTEDNPYRELRSSAVCNELYGQWSIFNSQRKQRNDRVQRILESLADSGELKKKDSFTFTAQGKLIVTLEHLKEEKAKHDRAENNAIWMRRLTVVLVVTALFQSELVRSTYYTDLDGVIEFIIQGAESLMQKVS